MQLRSFHPLLTFDNAHVRKDTSVSPPAQLQCSHSRVGEPGNEANMIDGQSTAAQVRDPGFDGKSSPFSV